MTSNLIVVKYPPDHDGQLNIFCNPDVNSYEYRFIHAKTGDSWHTLVSAARAIVAQDERIRLKHAKAHVNLENPHYIEPKDRI